MVGRTCDARSAFQAWPKAQYIAGHVGPKLPLNVQVFGRRDSRDTQKALRFFKERRVAVSLVDVAQRPLAAGELKRFRQRFGASALLDSAGRAYADGGLAYLRMDESELFDRLLAEPSLLRLPLVRAGSRLSIGLDEAAWRDWLAADD